MAFNIDPEKAARIPCAAAASSGGLSADDAREAIRRGAQLIELRIDQFPSKAPGAVQRELDRLAGIPKLCTIRHPSEGGGWTGDEAQRAALFRLVIPEADLLDIELSAKTIRREIIESARAMDRLVIGSFHDFEATPATATLDAVLSDGIEAGVQIVKIACHCNGPEDLRRLAAFLAAHPEDRLIVIGMGPYGIPSRVFFPALGSLITYTFLGKATAPGQLGLDALIDQLRLYYPDFADTRT
jgi:3-dehydroquinate dehydratase I